VTVAPHLESGFRDRFAEYGRTLDCVHCGLCLPYCPTYGVSGRESDSPRGRIYLMRGYAEGEIQLTPAAETHLDRCIVCRGCETVCPSGIHMGEMMESFRDEARRRPGKRLGRSIRDLIARALLMGILPHRRRIAALTDLLGLYERSGLRRLSTAVLARVAPRLRGLDDLFPPIPPGALRRIDLEAASRGGVFPAEGKVRMRVGLFLGCIASEWYAAAHRATIRVLQKNGCDVVVPGEQTCCGALHRHAGFLEDGKQLYSRNVQAFEAAGVEVVVVNAAGCGAALKEPPHGSAGAPLPVQDICEFLDRIGIAEPTRALRNRVAHHPPCHLVHAQKVGPQAVESLLLKIPGLTLVPLPDADRCCGAGGIYNLLHPEMAGPLRNEKVEAIIRSGAEIVATGNPGCWLQIRSGLSGRSIEVLHPVELLDRAYGG
jgi:glycolate oxidase iron-sulfur subunit